MVELSGNIPFLWRLSPESSDGFCMVSMVVPFEPDDEAEERRDLTIETSVVSFSSDSTRAENEETLEWNQDDMNLFLKLVTCQQQGEHVPVAESVRVDLTDPEIIEIIHVVAAAGFGTAYSSHGMLNNSIGRYPPHACDIGSFAALNTLDGFKRCVVVDMDGEDVVCVLLEEVDVVSIGEYDRLSRHDLLMVKTTDLLHPDFASDLVRPAGATLH
ncbi:MAG: hypothetical protein CMK70_09940 [Pseudohongiella sp.]|nr:hypothetical protein [Pseudohongiella sp.]|tara:strand:+ start:8730 stop:9374 length:645 start_codon:yes stop_codon:yes gene_type:complete